ncbi:MAG: bacteriohemerythrin [Lachnospirales bacterium]
MFEKFKLFKTTEEKQEPDFLEPLEWDISYCTGIAIVDRQHKELFEIVNTLVTYYNKICSKDVFLNFLNMLIDYVNVHFSTEENLLYNLSLKDYEEHKTEHDEFREKVMTAVEKEMNYDNSYRKELIVFLQNWLVVHIIESDVPLFTRLK